MSDEARDDICDGDSERQVPMLETLHLHSNHLTTREKITALVEIAGQIQKLAEIAHGLSGDGDRSAENWLHDIRQATGHVASRYSASILCSAVWMLDPEARIGFGRDNHEGVLRDFVYACPHLTPEQFIAKLADEGERS